MKKFAPLLIGAAVLISATLAVRQPQRGGSPGSAIVADEPAPRASHSAGNSGQEVSAETIQKSTSAPSSPATATSSVDTVSQLLNDVESGRLALETNEEEFFTLDLTQPDVVPIIVHLWVRQDSSAAIQWTNALPESALKEASLRQIAVTLAESGPAAAAAWVEALKSGPSRESALESLAAKFASTSPEWALSFASAMVPGGNRDQAFIHSLSQWAAQAPVAAAARASELEDSQLRSNALAAVAIAWAERDPVSAGTLAATEIEDPAAQSRAVISVIQRWVQIDPDTTAAWVAKFEPGPLANFASEQLVVQWSRRDADATRRWVSNLAKGPARDIGLATLARTLPLPRLN